MKKLKGLDEVHRVIETIYDEERDLTPADRLKKLREDSDHFLLERKLSLRRIKPVERKHVSV